MSKVLLKNGYVYTNEGIGKADVLLSADRLFLDFSENDLENTTVYNLEGKLIVPGFVDVHCIRKQWRAARGRRRTEAIPPSALCRT